MAMRVYLNSSTRLPLVGCVRLNWLRSEGVGKQSRMRSSNGTGACISHECSASIMAEPSSVRKATKRKEFVPDQKLADLRGLFGSAGIQAYIVPSEDAHQSEFIAECFSRRAYISGFTGSAGTVVVTLDKAALWTDGRYYLQASKQLGPEWTLMRSGSSGVPSYSEWLRDSLPAGSCVGIDSFLLTVNGAEELKRSLNEKEISLIYNESNLVDKIWDSERPAFPKSQLRVHDIKYAGVGVSKKLANLRKELESAGATAIIVSMLDEVAWLFNLRGGDVPHSPVTYAYAVVEIDKATLYVDLDKVATQVKAHLEEAGVTIEAYDGLLGQIDLLAAAGSKLWLDPSTVNAAIYDRFTSACNKYSEREENIPAALHRPSPIASAKAVKNDAELNGMKQAHLRDAAALVEFWAWLEEKIVNEKSKLTEVEVAENLLRFRSQKEGFLDTSFDTICGSGANGAIVHYRAEDGKCGVVDDEKLLLLDSGAQYIDGTTDITRTVHFGIPTHYQKECFTRVLKGHIALDRSVFPENTPGFVLDVLARSSLWKAGLDYRHGTGHGVGAALNVHEGPQSISARFGNITSLKSGMIVSNEPGYYEDNKFGIRIENIVQVCEENTANRYGGISYLGLECISFVPIQTKLMLTSLMSQEEIEWVNEYHLKVWEKVSSLVQGNALQWLRNNTMPIHVRTI